MPEKAFLRGVRISIDSGLLQTVVELVAEKIVELRAQHKVAEFVTLTMDALFNFVPQLIDLQRKGIFGCFGLRRAQLDVFAHNLKGNHHRMFERSGCVISVYQDKALVGNATTVFLPIGEQSTSRGIPRQLLPRFSDDFVWMLARLGPCFPEDLRKLSFYVGGSSDTRLVPALVSGICNISEQNLSQAISEGKISPSPRLLAEMHSCIIATPVCGTT